MNLARLQRAFQRHVLAGDRAIAAQVHAPALARLSVYARGYRLRLEEALASNFPALQARLGARGFRRLANAYVDRHPSRARNVRWFGHRLGRVLAADERWAARPWLAELARFEWALSIAFDAADAEPVGREALAAVEPARWPALRFLPHPSLGLLALEWNVPAMRKAADAATRLPAARRAARPVTWAIWRQDFVVHFGSLDAQEARALKALLRGASLERISLAWSAEGPDAPRRAAEALSGWVAAGWIVGLRR